MFTMSFFVFHLEENRWINNMEVSIMLTYFYP